jgi:predicted nucleic acid-binding protein
MRSGDRHAEILFDLLAELATAGNLTTDAHLAALAIEYQLSWYRQILILPDSRAARSSSPMHARRPLGCVRQA